MSNLVRRSAGAVDHILLTPGPVTTSPRVRQAALRTDFSHRDPAFGRLLDETASAIRDVAGAPAHETILLTGGATAATEAAFGTLIGPDETLLVLSNGAFGERLAEIARALDLPLRHLQQRWGEPISIDGARQVFAQDPTIRAVAMVQHETSVGCLNPVDVIGELAFQAGARLFVDAVSSLGGEVFDARAAHAAVVIGTANKCLHGIPGVSFVLVHPDAWEASELVAPRSLYFDLRRYRGAAGSHGIPFTPPVHAIVALHEALCELAEKGGVAARRKQYQALNAQIKAGLSAQGLPLIFSGPGTSCTLTVAGLPEGEPFDSFYHALRQRGFVVYQAKAAFRDTCFLAANMGHLDMPTIDRFLESVRDAAAEADRRKGPVGASRTPASLPVQRT
jgi:2-aminoethylphosphonate-pyruvate transaminase